MSFFDAHYKNANLDSSNEEAIDLKDESGKRVIQITSIF
jgi:hypothetical protein